MIQIGRISRLLHKAAFDARQRRIIDFSQRYTITDLDKSEDEQDISESYDVDKLLDGFDPEESKEDRRLLFEVTG